MALAPLGTRSPRTVGPGRQPASRVLRCATVLRMTAATDRAGSPCGPAGRPARNLPAEKAMPASRLSVSLSPWALGGVWLFSVAGRKGSVPLEKA